jgi:hypothetical protein
MTIAIAPLRFLATANGATLAELPAPAAAAAGAGASAEADADAALDGPPCVPWECGASDDAATGAASTTLSVMRCV